jgi:hypothetical protein
MMGAKIMSNNANDDCVHSVSTFLTAVNARSFLELTRFSPWESQVHKTSEKNPVPLCENEDNKKSAALS